MTYSIIVEGIADKIFIEQLLQYLGVSSSMGQVIETKGCSNLTAKDKEQTFINIMRRTTADGGINLVIFDADDDFNAKEKELLEWRCRNAVDFELFLFPNNKSTGELEDLLEKIINPENMPIFECWQGFESSLKTVNISWRKGTPLTIPAKKTKIYAYLETLYGESRTQKDKIKESKRNYLIYNHWHLDAPYLQPLRKFLIENLQQQ